MNEKMFWAAFSAIGADSRDLLKLHRRFGDLRLAWQALKSGNQTGLLRSGLTPEKITVLKSAAAKISPERAFNYANQKNTVILILPDGDFPQLLKQIPDPPAILYIRGKPQLLGMKAVAVVGTRRNTFYGEKATRQLAAGLASQGLVIVSGMAQGIDSLAHLAAVENGGLTIGVAAFGLERVPQGKKHIVKKILESGAVVSEYYPSRDPQPFTFVQRNRLISGLSLGTLVAEAPMGSGSLITANFALEQNREVWSVPGPIDQPSCEGSNFLIKQGAAPATCANDVLASLGLETARSEAVTDKKLEPGEKEITRLLSEEPQNMDQIAGKTGRPPAEILNLISNLEIKQIIRKTLDGFYHLT